MSFCMSEKWGHYKLHNFYADKAKLRAYLLYIILVSFYIMQVERIVN